MNKKAQDWTMAIYWFFILFIVTAAVVYMVVLFYGSPYDVRELEANLLVNNVADCISQKGELNKNLIDSGKFNLEFDNNFMTECKLNFHTESSQDGFDTDVQYYVKVSFFNGTNISNPVFSLEQGNNNLASSCEIANEDYQRLVKCITRRFYATSNNNQYLIEITGVVNKGEKNVK
jgi:hypothetical protein